MNYKQLLIDEHSKALVIKISDDIGDDKIKFKSIMELVMDYQAVYAPRAAWVMTYCLSTYPHLIKPYLKKLIPLLALPIHQGIKRNIVKYLQENETPTELESEVFAIIYSLIESKSESIAVRSFSIGVLAKICKKHPDLCNEAIILIESVTIEAEKGLKHKAIKTMQMLRKFQK